MRKVLGWTITCFFGYFDKVLSRYKQKYNTVFCIIHNKRYHVRHCGYFSKNTNYQLLESFNRKLGSANINAHPITVNGLHDPVKEETREIQHQQMGLAKSLFFFIFLLFWTLLDHAGLSGTYL